MVDKFIKALKGKDYRDMFVHLEEVPVKDAIYSRPEPGIRFELRQILRSQGIDELYSHQREAVDHVRGGKNPVLITPTASGKTLSFNLPILEHFLEHEGGHALYLFPLKALEQDQLKQLKAITSLLPDPDKFRAAVYDGDTPDSERRKIRADFPRFIMTNPEMLHLTVSGYHRAWTEFLKNLKFVVIDELHTYKGIFGSHMAQLFRRLDRICAHYGSNPQYIACSATIANPVELAENLTGKQFVLVEKSGAPAPLRYYAFLNPEISAYTVAARLFRLGISLGMKTIAFTKARKITELIFQWVLDEEPQLKGKISAYRAGFLPEERRDIEEKLNSGEMWGVISTSALEMGVDIGTLDLGILVGYPGTISTTFQRGGRVGRKQKSLVTMIAQANALDQYFMRNPKDFFGRSFEAAVVDKRNPHIMKQHLVCAAAEIALTKDDKHYSPEKYPELVRQLEEDGKLQRSADGKRWFSLRQRPQRDVNLRASGGMFTITDGRGKVIGTVSGNNVFAECHVGAIYLHMGKQYQVKELDLEAKNVTVKPVEVNYYTSTRAQKDTEILLDRDSIKLNNFILHIGDLRVTEWITGYEKRRMFAQELMGTFPLDLPEQSYETVGIWMEIPRAARDFCEAEELHFMGGIHSLEHALLSLVPLYAMCDRGDMGGISMVEHSGIGGPGIFLYDGYPGGVGLAERVFGIFDGLLEKTYHLVKNCPCVDGCPSCIYSPRCGSGNYPLDKKAVLALLERFTGQGDFTVKEIEKPPAPIIEVYPPVEEEEVNEKIRERQETGLEKTLVFDLETQKSADEVGGWGNIARMKLANAVTMELETGKYRIYYEEDAEDLILALRGAKMVIGFNLKRFDYTVLKPYGLTNPKEIATLDLMLEVQKVLGHRLSLDALCSATLGAKKSADGLQSIQWWKEGRLELITEYCQKDVRLTKELFEYGRNKGYVVYEHKVNGLVRIPVKW